jgi:hypothetical protein
MNGYLYLQTAVARRLTELVDLSAEARQHKLTSEPLISAGVVGRAATGTIILGVGHGFVDAPGEPLEIPPFVTFVPSQGLPPRIVVKATIAVADAIQKHNFFHDPLLASTRPGTGDVYWKDKLGGGGANTAALNEVVEDFLAARFRHDALFELAGDATAEAADIAVHAFFAGIVNGVVMQQTVPVDGLGTISRVEGSDELAFTPAARLLRAVRTEALHQRPLPHLTPTKAVEIPPDPNDPPVGDEQLLEHLEKSLPPELLDRTRAFLRSALNRQA